MLVCGVILFSSYRQSSAYIAKKTNPWSIHLIGGFLLFWSASLYLYCIYADRAVSDFLAGGGEGFLVLVLLFDRPLPTTPNVMIVVQPFINFLEDNNSIPKAPPPCFISSADACRKCWSSAISKARLIICSWVYPAASNNWDRLAIDRTATFLFLLVRRVVLRRRRRCCSACRVYSYTSRFRVVVANTVHPSVIGQPVDMK